MRLTAGLVLTVAAALCAHAWVLQLPLQWDDYYEIPMAGPRLQQMAHRLGLHSEEVELSDERSLDFFRPVIWGMWQAELAASGEMANPALFHRSSWYLHAVIMAALLILLWRLTGPVPATLGTLWCAVHPGAHQAVSWVAARGDLVVGLSGVGALALLAGDHARHRRALPLAAGLCLALGVGGKATGVATGAPS